MTPIERFYLIIASLASVDDKKTIAKYYNLIQKISSALPMIFSEITIQDVQMFIAMRDDVQRIIATQTTDQALTEFLAQLKLTFSFVSEYFIDLPFYFMIAEEFRRSHTSIPGNFIMQCQALVNSGLPHSIEDGEQKAEVLQQPTKNAEKNSQTETQKSHNDMPMLIAKYHHFKSHVKKRLPKLTMHSVLAKNIRVCEALLEVKPEKNEEKFARMWLRLVENFKNEVSRRAVRHEVTVADKHYQFKYLDTNMVELFVLQLQEHFELSSLSDYDKCPQPIRESYQALIRLLAEISFNSELEDVTSTSAELTQPLSVLMERVIACAIESQVYPEINALIHFFIEQDGVAPLFTNVRNDSLIRDLELTAASRLDHSILNKCFPLRQMNKIMAQLHAIDRNKSQELRKACEALDILNTHYLNFQKKIIERCREIIRVNQGKIPDHFALTVEEFNELEELTGHVMNANNYHTILRPFFLALTTQVPVDERVTARMLRKKLPERLVGSEVLIGPRLLGNKEVTSDGHLYLYFPNSALRSAVIAALELEKYDCLVMYNARFLDLPPFVLQLPQWMLQILEDNFFDLDNADIAEKVTALFIEKTTERVDKQIKRLSQDLTSSTCSETKKRELFALLKNLEDDLKKCMDMAVPSFKDAERFNKHLDTVTQKCVRAFKKAATNKPDRPTQEKVAEHWEFASSDLQTIAEKLIPTEIFHQNKFILTQERSASDIQLSGIKHPAFCHALIKEFNLDPTHPIQNFSQPTLTFSLRIPLKNFLFQNGALPATKSSIEGSMLQTFSECLKAQAKHIAQVRGEFAAPLPNNQMFRPIRDDYENEIEALRQLFPGVAFANVLMALYQVKDKLDEVASHNKQMAETMLSQLAPH